MSTTRLSQLLFLLLALACFTPVMRSAWALVAGIIFALTLGNPYASATRALTHRLLAWSVIGLGASMNLQVIARTGLQGIGLTAGSIALTLLAGLALGRLLHVPRQSAWLISAGTAICGGSAIAALAPILRAEHHHTSVALGVVFLLNALALVLFPPLGHWLHLTEAQFGLWSALAIHDTSSVVGATAQYGRQALEVGTTVKLTRALWIIPLALLVSRLPQHPSPNTPDASAIKTRKPWFIFGFLAMAALFTWQPDWQPVGQHISTLAHHCLMLTLFCIGASLSRQTLAQVGFRPLLQGALLWLATSVATLILLRLW